MIEYILASILTLSVYLLLSCWILPKRKLSRYANKIRQAGYKVYQEPFLPFNSSYRQQFKTAEYKYGDAFYNIKHNYSKYDVVVTNVADKILLLLIQPQLLQDFFSPEKMELYPKSQKLFGGLKELIGDGIGFSDGAEWKRKRKAISKLFNYDLIIKNIPKIRQIVDKNIDKMEQDYKVGQGQFCFGINELAISSFMGIMMRCFFGGQKIGENVNGKSFGLFMEKLVSDAGSISISPLVIIFGKHAMRIGLTAQIRSLTERMAIFRGIAKEFIDKRIKEINESTNPQSSDIISSLLLDQRKGDQSEEAINYTESEVLNQFCSNLIGGTDTTAHFFTMMVYYVAGNPQVEKKLRDQIDRFIITEEDINYETIKKLTYLKNFQDEVTRIYGPGTGILLRDATQDHFINKLPVPKGTLITINTSGSHYNEQYYKDPLVFRPERWESETDNLNPFAFMGFGGGARACLGKHLSMLETKITLIKLLRRYKAIKLPKKDFKMGHNLMYEPEHMKTVFIKKN